MNDMDKNSEETHSDSGYTLLEILVVLAIIGTLMSLVAPRLMGNVDKSKVIAAKAISNGYGGFGCFNDIPQ